jgi:hypothetical protein
MGCGRLGTCFERSLLWPIALLSLLGLVGCQGEVIEASVQTDRERQEITHVSQTIAQMLEAKGRKQGRKEGREEGREAGREEGREEGRREGELKALREALTRNLRSAFPDVPTGTLRTIQQVEDVGQLNAWLDRLRTARKLADVGIPVK